MESDTILDRAVRRIMPMPGEPCERLLEVFVVHTTGGDDQIMAVLDQLPQGAHRMRIRVLRRIQSVQHRSMVGVRILLI